MRSSAVNDIDSIILVQTLWYLYYSLYIDANVNQGGTIFNFNDSGNRLNTKLLQF